MWGAIYVSSGEKDKAMEWLEKAYDRHAGYLLGINFDSSFDDIRSDPRFQALLKKIGFLEASLIRSNSSSNAEPRDEQHR